MALHHFYWAGKERSVAVSKTAGGTTVLRFIEPELVEKGFEKIAVKKGDSFDDVVCATGTAHPETLRDILCSLRDVLKPFDVTA